MSTSSPQPPSASPAQTEKAELLSDPTSRTNEEAWAFAMQPRHNAIIAEVARQYPRHLVSREDLWQAGRLGLYQAAVRFDPHRGFTFYSYALFWVRAEIVECIGRAERGPHASRRQRDDARRYRRLVQAAHADGEPTPSDEEMAVRMGCGTRAVVRARTLAQQRLTSLDLPAFQDPEQQATARKVDCMVGNAPSESELTEMLDELLDLELMAEGLLRLQEHSFEQHYVLVHRHGLLGYPEQTARALLDELQVTKTTLHGWIRSGKQWLAEWMTANQERRWEVYRDRRRRRRQTASGLDGSWVHPLDAVVDALEVEGGDSHHPGEAA